MASDTKIDKSPKPGTSPLAIASAICLLIVIAGAIAVRRLTPVTRGAVRDLV